MSDDKSEQSSHIKMNHRIWPLARNFHVSVEFHGIPRKRGNSQLGSKFRDPLKAVGPIHIYNYISCFALWCGFMDVSRSPHALWFDAGFCSVIWVPFDTCCCRWYMCCWRLEFASSSLPQRTLLLARRSVFLSAMTIVNGTCSLLWSLFCLLYTSDAADE